MERTPPPVEGDGEGSLRGSLFSSYFFFMKRAQGDLFPGPGTTHGGYEWSSSPCTRPPLVRGQEEEEGASGDSLGGGRAVGGE